MNLSRTFLLLDTIGQGILMTLIVPGAILSFFWGNDEWRLFSILGLLFLGIWQFVGNLLWIASTNDKWRLHYFKIVTGYFLLGIVLFQVVNASTLWAAYWMILPFGIAIYYFRLTTGLLVGTFRAPRSFWDL